MVPIKKLDCSQQIDQQDHIWNIFPPIIQQEQVEFGIATGIIWKTATTANLRKTSSENLPFLLVRAEFGKTAHYRTNLVHSEQNPCFIFSRFISICSNRSIQNCHSLFQRISELAHLMMSWRSNIQSGKYIGGQNGEIFY